MNDICIGDGAITVRFYMYSLAGAVSLGLMPLFKKLAIVGGTDTFIVAQTSSLVAVLAALFLAKAAFGHQPRQLFRRGVLPHLLLIGSLGSGVVVLLNVEAMQMTSATNRSLFQAMYPTATVLFAWWMLGERLRWSHYGLIAIMVFGLFLMNSTAKGLEVNRGFWMLIATLPIIGFCDAYAKKHITDIPPPLMASGRLVFGLVLLTLSLLMVSAESWRGTTSTWHWLLLGGLFNATGLFAFYRAMSLKAAGLAAALVSVAPVLTAVGEWVALDAALRWWQLGGLLLVILGATVLAMRS